MSGVNAEIKSAHDFIVMMLQNDDYGVQTKYTLHLFSIFWLLYSDYITDLIKKLELCLTVVSVLLEIRFELAQISAPKSVF